MDRPKKFEDFVTALTSPRNVRKIKNMLLGDGINIIETSDCLDYLKELDGLDMMCILNIKENKK